MIASALPSHHEGSWTNRPFAKSASANRPPKKVGPRQIGPLKIRPSANRPPVENFYKYKLSIEFIDLHKALDWVVFFSASLQLLKL